MYSSLMLISTNTMNKLAVTEILECNKITSRYGLILSKAEAQQLIETRIKALKSNGRIEFAGGIISKIIIEFCDSPFIFQSNYATTLNDLIEIFYYFKNETLDEISDDELIALMKKYFDENCQGSIELLQGRELETLARNIRFGITDNIDSFEDIDESFGEGDYDE